MRTVILWLVRLLLLVVVGTVLARVVGSVRDGRVVPAIGGDTWPPVPVKPAPARAQAGTDS